MVRSFVDERSNCSMMAGADLFAVQVEDGPFLPGEAVLGSVRLHPCSYHSLAVHLVGEYYCCKGKNEVFEIFSIESCLLDSKGAGEGVSDIPFKLGLRGDSPSSIATRNGGIRYRVTAQMMVKDPKPEIAEDFKNSVFISVVAHKQIEEDKLGKRESIEDRKFCFCCFGALTGEMEVAHTNLLSGVKASVNARIVNTTNSSIAMTALSLVQIVVQKKEGKSYKYEVAKVERGSVPAGKQQVWLSERFNIPPLPTTRSDAFFDVSYRFVMCIQKSPSKTIKLKIPVTIGNFLGSELPKTWKQLDGVDFCIQGGGHGIQATYLPLYVNYSF